MRSLVQPVGIPWIQVHPDPKAKGVFNQLLLLIQPTLRSWHDDVIDEARDVYMAKIEADGKPMYVTRVDVILKTDPFDPESVKTLKTLQTWLKIDRENTNILGEHLQSECYGITAIGQDLAEVTESDRYRVNSFVLAAILWILVVLVRKIWLAIYLLVTVLASYYAALGATALAGFFWTGAVLADVDWRVPFFLFTILVAVGEDYHFIGMSHRERKKYGLSGCRRSRDWRRHHLVRPDHGGHLCDVDARGTNTLMQIDSRWRSACWWTRSSCGRSLCRRARLVWGGKRKKWSKTKRQQDAKPTFAAVASGATRQAGLILNRPRSQTEMSLFGIENPVFCAANLLHPNLEGPGSK